MRRDRLTLDNKEKLLDYLRSNTVVKENGCWKWVGYIRPDGHGTIKINQEIFKVHRVSAHLFLSLDINNSNIQVNHKQECPYPNCWNPEHLYLGTQQDNIKDKNELILKSEKFPCGHLREEANKAPNGHGGYVCLTCKNYRERVRWRTNHGWDERRV